MALTPSHPAALARSLANEGREIALSPAGAQRPRQPAGRSLWALDGVNFLAANVGLGPYLALYLGGARHWSAGDVGVALAASSLAGAVSQIPAGMLIDALRFKRSLVCAAALASAVGCLVIAIRPEFAWVLGAQASIGAAAAVPPPALAALCRGLVGHECMPAQLSRNQAFSHAGAFSAAVLIGAGGSFWGYGWIFGLVCAFAVGTAIVVFSIRATDIDHVLARGGEGDASGAAAAPAELREIAGYRDFLVFLGAVVLFHFGNAAMLPMAGQVLARAHPGEDTLALSACIVVAQLVMAGVALVVGRALDAGCGRKTIFLIMLALLPVRGALFALFDANPWAMVAIQTLDGVAAGVFGVVAVVVAADLMRGAGRFNLGQGLVALSTGVGAVLSNLTAGFVVERFGYPNGFLYLSTVAVFALIFSAAFMPETGPAQAKAAGRSPSSEAATP